jgi:cyclopropane-fatty-acyl-phospholipid synthase
MVTLPRLSIRACNSAPLPDWLIRVMMRRLIGKYLSARQRSDAEDHNETSKSVLEHASSGPLAGRNNPSSAWDDELPPACYEKILGPRMHAGSCLFEPGIRALEQAEHAMLALIADRARIRDGQSILELGCGWGAFSLWAAQRFPHATLHAVANAPTQTQWLTARAREHGLANLSVETCAISRFDPGTTGFDRIVSIETIEAVRNIRELLGRCARWLDDHGRLFVQMVAHRYLDYRPPEEAKNDWLPRAIRAREIIPSASLLAFFQQDLLLRDHWWLAGSHYRDTANAWLARLDAARDQLVPMLTQTYGEAEARREFARWRLCCLATAELFGYRHGHEWGIGQYLFSPRQALAYSG